tara:strand:+ start:121 stop:438 length:318 start_codon:yes stop_codon:yes gene_type:complete
MEEIWNDIEYGASVSISYEITLGAWVMHFEEGNINKITPRLYRKLLIGLNTIKEILKAKKISHIYGICETKKERKFNELFGFKQVPNGIILTEEGLLNYLTVLEI